MQGVRKDLFKMKSKTGFIWLSILNILKTLQNLLITDLPLMQFCSKTHLSYKIIVKLNSNLAIKYPSAQDYVRYILGILIF